MAHITSIPCSKVFVERSVLPRASLRVDIVEEYLEAYKAGESLPPITCFYDGKTYNIKDQVLLADGMHRLYARRKDNFTSIDTTLMSGTEADAMLYAARCNRSHGLRRSHADLVATVKMLLRNKEWKHRSNVWLAEACGVSDSTIHSIMTALGIRRKKVIAKNGEVRAGYLDKEIRKQKIRKVKQLRAQGKTYEEISKLLGISFSTVHKYNVASETETQQVVKDYKISFDDVVKVLDILEPKGHLKYVSVAIDHLIECLVPLTYEEVPCD